MGGFDARIFDNNLRKLGGTQQGEYAVVSKCHTSATALADRFGRHVEEKLTPLSFSVSNRYCFPMLLCIKIFRPANTAI
jgi:hypothetical protein